MLRGTSITLTGQLPGVNRHTIRAIGQARCRLELRELELKAFFENHLSDDQIAQVVSKLPVLEVLDLS